MREGEQTPLRKVWVTLREYVTHWVIAGIILSLTGFVPEEWFARLIHGLALPEGMRTYGLTASIPDL